MSTEAITIGSNPIQAFEDFSDTLSPGEFIKPKMVHRDLGGFYTAEFSVVTKDRERALEFLNNAPGREVSFHSDKGIMDWEGMIRTVSFDTGVARVKNDLRNMANAAFVRYTPVGGGAVARSTTQEDATSQSRWGKKLWVLAGGEMSAALADQRAQQFLDQAFWAAPQLESINQGGQLRDELEIRFLCIGYYLTMDWSVYNQTVLLGEVDANVIIADILGDADVAQFIAGTEIEDNTTQITREYDADRRPTSILEAVASVGDAENTIFVCGVGPGRIFYYREGAQATLPS